MSGRGPAWDMRVMVMPGIMPANPGGGMLGLKAEWGGWDTKGRIMPGVLACASWFTDAELLTMFWMAWASCSPLV